jgi:carbon-monoxide dehydrogenase small subunit
MNAQTTINGQTVLLPEASLQQNLLYFLREELDLTGAKNGCGIGACGACSVLVDQKVIKACRREVLYIVGRSVLTVEGLAQPRGKLHPLQQSFLDYGAIQCGFCTPGMLLTAHGFLLKNHRPTRDEIRRAISPNLCRCTGYQQIIDAIEAAAVHYRPLGAEAPREGEHG